MKTSQIISTVSTLIDSKIPSFLWGTSSIKKASVIEQIAANKTLKFIPLNASLINPNSLWTDSSFLPKDAEGILFFDDLDCAPSDMQAFVYQLIAHKKVGEYILPEGWIIIGAGNTDKISSSLANHFVHLDIHVDVQDWKNWAFGAGVDERVIAYISSKNEDLFSDSVDDKSFASPASWENVSKILRSGMDESLLLEVLSGTIGKEKALSFLSFCEAAHKLPDIEAILQKGEAKYPKQKDVLYTLSSILVSFLVKYQDEDNLKNVLKYITKLESEFSLMIVQDLQGCGVHLQDLDLGHSV